MLQPDSVLAVAGRQRRESVNHDGGERSSQSQLWTQTTNSPTEGRAWTNIQLSHDQHDEQEDAEHYPVDGENQGAASLQELKQAPDREKPDDCGRKRSQRVESHVTVVRALADCVNDRQDPGAKDQWHPGQKGESRRVRSFQPPKQARRNRRAGARRAGLSLIHISEPTR